MTGDDPIRMNRRILVCGSRDWPDAEAIFARLLKEETGTNPPIIVHGAARGADMMADAAARALGFPREAHPANWTELGPRAGLLRNDEMLESGVDLVIAFRLSHFSPGTNYTIKHARARGIPVEVYDW